jgi:hypothetical protein
MPDEHPSRSTPDPSLRPMLRSLLIELAIYTPLVVIYFFLFIHFAAGPLVDVYRSSTIAYALFATAAILAQGVLLERFTAWLLNRFGLRS